MGQKPEASYAECLKIHEHLGGKTDGCQEFEATGKMAVNCSICGCHRKFHRIVLVEHARTVTQVVYTECHKIHNMQGSLTKDGCKEFKSSIYTDRKDYCFVCECHKNFHRNEITKDIPPVAGGTDLTRGHQVKRESCG